MQLLIKNGNKYNIDISKLKERKEVDMLFMINTPLNNIDNSQYINEKKLEKEYSYINKRNGILALYAIGSLTLFVISNIINKKAKISNYKKEIGSLVSPILAETIIDGKTGLKELIMTTIIELHIRGNIKIINNETIELISRDNLEAYEKGIIELLFEKKI